MASGKLKDTWYIWVLLIVAAVFAAMAFSKGKPAQVFVSGQKEDIRQTQPSAQAQTSGTSTVAVTAAGIKPDHSVKDMKEIATKKPASAVVVPPRQVAPTERYAIQVHSFNVRKPAERALKALKDKNYNAYIMVSDLGPRGIWYRVRVGSFNNVNDAQQMLEKITKEFQSGILVTE